MRIGYVGNFEPEWSTENDVRLALESLGHTVITLQENQLTADRLRSEALASDLLLWTGTWEAVPGPNWCSSTPTLGEYVDVLHDMAAAGIPSATYHLDIFWGVGRDGRRWWQHPMMHTAHVFTADGDHAAQWEHFGARHYWLPPGVRHTAVHEGVSRPEYVCDLAFVGSNGHGYHEDCWPYRRQLVVQLRDMAERNGWVWRNPGGDHPKVDRGAMNDFYASAKVTVGDSLCPNRETSRYWSDRAAEAPGRGGFLIMPRIDALAEDYDGHLPMYDWGDFAGLEAMIEGYLTDPEERERVRKTCHGLAVDRHTYRHRMQTLLDGVTRDDQGHVA